jgi:hypothetical protein
MQSWAMRVWVLMSESFELAMSSAVGTVRQDEELHFRVVFHHGVGDVLQKRCLSGAGRGDDQAALAFSNGRNEVDHAGGEAFGNSLQLDALIGVHHHQLLKDGEVLDFLGILTLDLGEAEHLRAAVATAGLALDPHAIAEAVFADEFGSDENVVVRLGVIAARLAQEAEAFS